MRIRKFQAEDFEEVHRLDLACFVPGISYSAGMLKYFFSLPAAICLVAEDGFPSESGSGVSAGNTIVGFILAEAAVPQGHIITLDVAESQRRTGTGSALLRELEERMATREVKSIVLETAVDNESGIAFWEHHGYRTEAVIKQYYLGRIDAWEMRKKLG